MASQAEADRTLSAFGAELLGNPNVGYAAVTEEKGDWVLLVGVYSAALNDEARRLQAEGAPKAPTPIPITLPIPGEDGTISSSRDANTNTIRVVVTETGRIEAQYKDRHRPAEGGDSIGNGRFNSAGTLGAPITVSTLPNRVFVITNWHVLVQGGGTTGDVVLQPAFLDGGRAPADWMANLTWSSLTDRVDLAIAHVRQPYNDFVALGRTRCFGQIRGTQLPQVGQSARKCGRTTDATTGTVRSVNASVNVSGYPGTRTFNNQILLTNMSRPGDSGSVVLSGDRMIGLLFAGDSSTVTIANRVDEVESALGSARTIMAALPDEVARLGFGEV